MSNYQNEKARKSHLFEGRYENIHLTLQVGIPKHSGNLIIYNGSGNTGTEKIEISPVSVEHHFLMPMFVTKSLKIAVIKRDYPLPST